jgi:hypothetical protein
MARKHIVLYPSGAGVDFFRAERSYDGIWLRSGTASWLTTLLPQVLASVEACDFTFSSFREIPLGDPALMPLPPNAGYAVKLLAPCGGYYDAQWSAILFHSESHPPALCGDRFVPENGGIRRQVQEFFSETFIDSMRKPDRPRVELWIRHALEIETMLPNAFDAPRWLRETHGLSAQEAAAKIAGLRTAMGPGEYQRLRQAEKAKREAEQQAEEDAVFEERRQQWLAEQVEQHAAEQEVRAYVDGIARTHTTEPVDAPHPEQPEPGLREKTIAAKKLKSKLSRAVKSKVAADKANQANAEVHAAKVVRRLEQEGKL